MYLDRWQGIRGQAAGAVMTIDRSADELLRLFVGLIPELEAKSPWKLKKQYEDLSKLPRLRVVNLLNWSGDYIGLQTTKAQCLPNEDYLKDEFGSVNLIYSNTMRALFNTGDSWSKEFMSSDVFDKYESLLFDAGQIKTMLHELGHGTGTLDNEFSGRSANEILGEEYSALEEARADLFALYAMPHLVRIGILTEEQMVAEYNGYIMTMIAALKFKPLQAHMKNRNMIYHFMERNRAIKVTKKDGIPKFYADIKNMSYAASLMLGALGDIKSYGNVELARSLREEYCYDDPMRPEIEDRTKKFPVGAGLIFPRLVKRNGVYTPELSYPTSFSDQPRYQHKLLDRVA